MHPLWFDKLTTSGSPLTLSLSKGEDRASDAE